MAKISGMGAAVSVDDGAAALQVISNDVTSYSQSTPRGVADVTGVNKSAMERMLLLADYQLTLNGGVNTTATTGSHVVLKTISSTSILRTTTIVVGSQTLTSELMYSDYSLTRAQDGSLLFTATGALGDGTIPTWS